MLHNSSIFEAGLDGFNISDGKVTNRKTALSGSYILSISASPPQVPKPRTEPKDKKVLQDPRKHGLLKNSKHTVKSSHSSLQPSSSTSSDPSYGAGGPGTGAVGLGSGSAIFIEEIERGGGGGLGSGCGLTGSRLRGASGRERRLADIVMVVMAVVGGGLRVVLTG